MTGERQALFVHSCASFLCSGRVEWYIVVGQPAGQVQALMFNAEDVIGRRYMNGTS